MALTSIARRVHSLTTFHSGEDTTPLGVDWTVLIHATSFGHVSGAKLNLQEGTCALYKRGKDLDTAEQELTYERPGSEQCREALRKQRKDQEVSI